MAKPALSSRAQRIGKLAAGEFVAPPTLDNAMADRSTVAMFEALAASAAAAAAAFAPQAGQTPRPEQIAFIRAYVERNGGDLAKLAEIGIEW